MEESVWVHVTVYPYQIQPICKDVLWVCWFRPMNSVNHSLHSMACASESSRILMCLEFTPYFILILLTVLCSMQSSGKVTRKLKQLNDAHALKHLHSAHRFERSVLRQSFMVPNPNEPQSLYLKTHDVQHIHMCCLFVWIFSRVFPS